MKKVINGKLYNTDTAEAVARNDNGYSFRDFNYTEETLYQKKTGEFFLVGTGGAMSIYSQRCGTNEWCGGERLIPLTVDEAKEWCEENASGEEYIAIFGEVEE